MQLSVNLADLPEKLNLPFAVVLTIEEIINNPIFVEDVPGAGTT
jgi:hypothetical protein